jgi:glycosyltransferase involved in cell wall biosynthesis
MSAAAPSSRPHVLIISASPVGEVMTGPAIRSWEFAQALRPHADVEIAAVTEEEGAETERADVLFRQQDPRPLRPFIERADVIISQPPWPLVAYWARRSGARLIYDLYGPEPLEMLAHRAAVPPPWWWSGRMIDKIWDALTLDRVLGALGDAHHIVCASEKQRDLWIGAMLADGVIDEALYQRDPSLRSAIDVAPFGLPSEPPKPAGSGGIRGRFPEIAADDEIVLWNGGIWTWLDAPTVIRGVGRLIERRPTVRLVFISSNPSGKPAEEEAHALARELGLMDRIVFFNDTWVPYDERVDWLLEANCAASAHSDNLETRFAFRTRQLDCFWAGLPIVCTEGDELATRVELEGLGRTVPPGNPEAMADALEDVLENGRESYATNLAAAAEQFTWPRVTDRIVRFTTAPGHPPRIRGNPLAHPARWARGAAFTSARSVLNAVGLEHWP